MAIIIDNQTFYGNNVTIRNNKIIVDGVDVTNQLPDQKTYNIKIDGNVDKLDVATCNELKISGDVKDLSTASGDVYCANITGNISTQSGDVDCGGVGGSISTMSGDVTCETVAGSVKTMSGDIKHRK